MRSSPQRLSFFAQMIKLPKPVITRFAPSPTGYLHLGHVASALFVWSLAELSGAELLLRIEDHDGQRSRAEYHAAILTDLGWLGFEWARLAVQSCHRERYEKSLANLISQGLVYACSCSRKMIQERLVRTIGDGRMKAASELSYDGYCRERNLPIDLPQACLRLKVSSSSVPFSDLYLGAQEQAVFAGADDFPLRDREGFFTYLFTNTLDDKVEGVNLIVRGQDLLTATAKQLYLRKLLGRKTRPGLICSPLYCHHPLLMNAKQPDMKLSKSRQDLSLATMRASGLTPEAIFGEVMAQLAYITSPQPLSYCECKNLIQMALP